MESGAGEIDSRAVSQTADDVEMTNAIQRRRFVLKILNQGALEFGVLIALKHHVEGFDYYRAKAFISRGAVTRDINLGVAAAAEAVFNVVTTIDPALQKFEFGHYARRVPKSKIRRPCITAATVTACCCIR